jgi:hypothetical protein
MSTALMLKLILTKMLLTDKLKFNKLMTNLMLAPTLMLMKLKPQQWVSTILLLMEISAAWSMVQDSQWQLWISFNSRVESQQISLMLVAVPRLNK